jgi:predicted GNAT family acetyltransferase
MSDELLVRDNVSANRFEIRIGEEVSFLQYRRTGAGGLVLIHTEVPQALRGRGLGGRLVKAALDAVRAEGRRVVPRCPFTRSYIERHPEYAQLVESRPL